ncbi:transducin/WD40 repeat-like superfamily protein [Artemisia annua]|uniref:Transducin/WD40 repeat-like superfamily protein n=1 Tax=Artemisia annua TaxID=35608 RepID=A0A2U1LEA7_ARTAN|nr:transducin/WD40 repeat-like superfamily protein [Artemisia annua]
MASTSSSSSPSSSSASSHHHELIHPHLLRELVTLINSHVNSLLSSPKARKTIENKCTSSLNSTREHKSLDMSEQTVLGNLYHGIQNVELCIKSKCSQHIITCEKMLQAPASLDENGITAGVSNAFLVCCAYFYLCLLRKLVEGDEVQVALYFLQALVVSPGLVKSELAPELYKSVVESCIVPLRPELGCGVEGVRWGATSYKAWLMYYQVISYGQQPTLLMDTSPEFRSTKACSTSSSKSYEHVQLHNQNCVKVHPIDPQQNEHAATIEPTVSNKVSEKSGVKRLQDLLLEDQSDTSSLYSDTSEYAVDDAQEYVVEFDKSLRTLREALEEQQLETSITMSKTPETLSFSSPSSELVFWNCLQNEDEPTCQTFQREYTRESSPRRDEILFSGENSYRVEQAEIVEKVISKLCFSENDNDDDSMSVEITTVYEMLASKPGLKYSLLKDVILDQLLMALSTSKEEGVTRASVSILLSIISSNPSVIEDAKKKGLNLNDLTNALKRDVHEAAVLIYLINPSPNEIMSLDLMPTLIKIICCYKSGLNLNSKKSLVMTPPLASIMIIQVLVTAFDYETNSTHLAEICSPKVISGLVNVPRNGNIEEVITLADILVKCMRFDGQCRYHISQFTPISPFISLILSNHKDGILVGLEYYHELLRMPRSSSTSLLHQLKEQGGIDIICVLLLAIQQTQPEYKVLAASLLLQLDVLEESVDNILNREVAIKTLLESLTCEGNPDAQQLAAYILSNLGGTYAWSGESYTKAWLVKKTGLNSMLHKNIVKNIDWLDDTLQDCGTEVWCAKVARDIIKLGDPVFYALEKGLKSKNKRVSRYCLTTIAWIGCEIVKGSDNLRCLACDILLSTIEQYVHPGMELEERLLACLCIYNYTFGRDGVRESLRRLSSITWMAEELLKVADYYMPNKWRISCVHTQVLEANYNGSGAVNSLMYYRGHLFSGYSNGSIKVWDIKGQTATLILDIMEHKKAVTCFTLMEQGNYLLSGSSDKTIRIWQMFERQMQCIEVITTKDSIQSLETCGEMIFVVTHNHKMKVFDSSRKVKDVLKNKHVKCIRSSQGKVYIGCMDSSIQELYIGNNRQQEIKAPSKSWRMQNKPIYSLALYKDWLYSASTCVDGSKIKDWKRQSKAQVSIVTEKRANVLAMNIVEDFIYLNTSNSPSNLEIWLRGTQHKVGRLSAGSKITSMLTANDMILCGTESGLIKGWIPL